MFVLAAVAVLLAWSVPVELENVEVGDEIIILGEYYRNVETSGSRVRWPTALERGSPLICSAVGLNLVIRHSANPAAHPFL